MQDGEENMQNYKKFGKGRGVFSFFFSRWKYRNWCAVGIHKTDYEEKQIDETGYDIFTALL